MTHVTAKTMLTYLYYVECNQDSFKVYNMIYNNIKPTRTHEEINQWASNHIDLLNNTITIVDDDYPFRDKEASFLIMNMFVKKENK